MEKEEAGQQTKYGSDESPLDSVARRNVLSRRHVHKGMCKEQFPQVIIRQEGRVRQERG